jgi:uncharacterized protein
MRIRVLTCLTLAFLFAAGAQAQQPSASHVQAVEEMLQVMNVSVALDRTIDLMLQAQIDANPEIKPYEDIMRQFLAKYLSWESLKPEMIQMYAEAFTEPELHELAAFYRTPLGQKAMTKMPELVQKGSAMGQKAVQDHLPELQEAIAKKMRESEGTSKKP